MIFIETSTFTRRVKELLKDEDYRELQIQLVENPQKGALIPGSGGLYKLRWAAKGRGKRGGLRIIYYWIKTEHKIFMLYIYPKSEQEDLTPAQIKQLRKIIEGK